MSSFVVTSVSRRASFLLLGVDVGRIERWLGEDDVWVRVLRFFVLRRAFFFS